MMTTENWQMPQWMSDPTARQDLPRWMADPVGRRAMMRTAIEVEFDELDGKTRTCSSCSSRESGCSIVPRP